MTRPRARIAVLVFFSAAWPSRAFATPPQPPPGRAERCVAAAERGQQEKDRAAFVEARADFRVCASDECPALVRKDCVQWLGDVETNLPSVVLGAKDARGNDLLDARILVDGKSYKEDVDAGRAIALDPGPHVFRFEHAPDSPVELTLVLRTGERNRPIYGTFGGVQAAAPPPPVLAVASRRVTHVSPWAYALGAVAVAGGASFAAFGVAGLNEKSQLRAQCNDTCSDQAIAPLKVDYITADVSLGLGVVAAAVSIWLFLHPSVETVSEPAAGFVVVPSREGGSVGWGGRF